MIGLIIVGHGFFSEGILSSVKLIAGEQQEVIGVNFECGQGSDILKGNIENAIDNLNTDEVLILADLAGGSPFNVSVIISEKRKDKNIKVISGMNLPMVLEASLSRSNYTMEELVESVKNAGTIGIKEYKRNKIKETVENDDGI
ncbi:UNVERIFIED_ORG: PTS fructose transporter subunit IIA [Clostridium botulinum]|uniref:PTS sugar transporter subunit IIA n=1 Tax=Clostridium botulinum TaxID=1491 RepID=A0A6B4FM87_CLOBO|nr:MULTISPECIES: PTS sugar transporter subunit IIA [Clostridium]ACD53060.1 PTS system fructose IIA component [Clostridium botulinum E3 str. Alaska E43]AJF30691.1 PTS fructose transporter subunit IIA [Clostridium botulinum]AJF33754.1 PTS fructose transporter subunit IIA [Clostridium botulinum]MBN1036569.1 PTS sugar transporter subunit IIA [Clostridium botulinum]MBN1043262.1 PTS sugar transporter subunit IIA [Clostridium botulinum]